MGVANGTQVPSSGIEFGFSIGAVDEAVKLIVGTVVRGVVMSFWTIASLKTSPSLSLLLITSLETVEKTK